MRLGTLMSKEPEQRALDPAILVDIQYFLDQTMGEAHSFVQSPHVGCLCYRSNGLGTDFYS